MRNRAAAKSSVCAASPAPSPFRTQMDTPTLRVSPAELDRLVLDLIELSTRQNFPYWLAVGAIFQGWALPKKGRRRGAGAPEQLELIRFFTL